VQGYPHSIGTPSPFRTLTLSLPYPKHSTPEVQNHPKTPDWQSESVRPRDWRGTSFRLWDFIGGVAARCNPRTLQRATRIISAVKAVSEQVGRSMAQVALAWLRHQTVPVIPIIGARKVSQLQDNLASLDLELSAEQLKSLDGASRIELGFPQSIYEREMVRATRYRGMWDRLLLQYDTYRGVGNEPCHKPEDRFGSTRRLQIATLLGVFLRSERTNVSPLRGPRERDSIRYATSKDASDRRRCKFYLLAVRGPNAGPSRRVIFVSRLHYALDEKFGRGTDP
jgi:aldo/keto reductase family protein